MVGIRQEKSWLVSFSDYFSLSKGKALALSLAILTTLVVSSKAYAETRTVTSSADDNNPGTLRNTIAAANPGDTIVFAPSLANQVIFLDTARQSLIIDRNLSINGGNLSLVISASGGQFSVFKVTNGAFSISDLTITGSAYALNVLGGAISSSPGTILTVTNCHITGNQALNGGGIYAQGSINMVGTVVSNNHALGGTGGVTVDGVGNPLVTITACDISGNQGISSGGLIILRAHGTIYGTTIDNNIASESGGAVTHASDVIIEDCFIRSNRGFNALRTTAQSTSIPNNVVLSNTEIADNRGVSGQGHVSLSTSNCRLTMNNNCRLLNNHGTAVRIMNLVAPATISDSVIDNNDDTGLLYPPFGSSYPITLDNCRVTNNRGGGIENGWTMHLINGSRVEGNAAPNNRSGGGIVSFGNLTINNSTIAHNSGGGEGGGGIAILTFPNRPSSLTINNSTVSGNTARTGHGGGIYAVNSLTGTWPVLVSVSNCTIFGNTADTGKGGGLYFDSRGGPSSLTLTSSTIAQNRALSSGIGGGVFSELRPTATVSVNNTIVATNLDEQNNSPDFFGSVSNDVGFNLVGKSDGSDGWTASKLIGTIEDPINAMLDPLADNGGPTHTCALLPGSPAIGAGNPQFIGQPDQRGITRGDPNDIGSFYTAGRSGSAPDRSVKIPYRGRLIKNVLR